jgi:hypothetical protein
MQLSLHRIHVTCPFEGTPFMQGPVVRVIKRVCLRVGASRSSRGNLDWGRPGTYEEFSPEAGQATNLTCAASPLWPPLIVHRSELPP